MKVIILSEEGNIYQTTATSDFSSIIKKYISRNFQLRHPITKLPFSVVLVCSPLKSNKRVNPIVPILFPEVKTSIKGDVLLCKECVNDYNTYSFQTFSDDEVEEIRKYFLDNLTIMKEKIDKERQLYLSFRKGEKDNAKQKT